MPKRKFKDKQSSQFGFKKIILNLLTGSFAGILSFFIIICLISEIAFKQDKASINFAVPILVSNAAASYLCGFCAVRPLRRNGAIMGILSSMPMYFIIVLIAVIFNKSGLSSTAWIMFAVSIVFSALGGIIATNKRKKRH